MVNYLNRARELNSESRNTSKELVNLYLTCDDSVVCKYIANVLKDKYGYDELHIKCHAALETGIPFSQIKDFPHKDLIHGVYLIIENYRGAARIVEVNKQTSTIMMALYDEQYENHVSLTQTRAGLKLRIGGGYLVANAYPLEESMLEYNRTNIPPIFMNMYKELLECLQELATVKGLSDSLYVATHVTFEEYHEKACELIEFEFDEQNMSYFTRREALYLGRYTLDFSGFTSRLAEMLESIKSGSNTTYKSYLMNRGN